GGIVFGSLGQFARGAVLVGDSRGEGAVGPAILERRQASSLVEVGLVFLQGSVGAEIGSLRQGPVRVVQLYRARERPARVLYRDACQVLPAVGIRADRLHRARAVEGLPFGLAALGVVGVGRRGLGLPIGVE